MGLSTQQMVQAGYSEGWGIGRHVLGSNYFKYVRDPWDSYCEYSYDIDFVEAGAALAQRRPYWRRLALFLRGWLCRGFVVNHEI